MALIDNLVSYWKLDETSGTRNDSHGSNHLTDNNTVGYGAGKISDAADFEKDNTESLSRADNADLSTGDVNLSVQAWVKLESKSSFMSIVAKHIGVNDGSEYMLYYDSTNDYFAFAWYRGANPAITANTSGFGTISTGVWYHLIAYHDADNDLIGVAINNQTPATSATSGSYSSSTTGDFYIGSRIASLPFDGLIDEVGFWKRVLTSQERTDLYNSGNGLAYPFSKSGSGSIAGIGSPLGVGRTTRSGTGIVTGVSSLLGISKSTRSGTGFVGAVGSVVGIGRTVRSGTGLVGGIGSLVGNGFATIPNGYGLVGGIGSIVGVGSSPQTGAGNIGGIGSPLGVGARVSVGTGSVLSVGSILGVGYQSPSAYGFITGIGSPLGVGRTTYRGLGIVSGITAIVGVGEATEVEETLHAKRFRRSDMRMLLRTHGETITYHPSGIGSRSVKALIERDVSIPGEVDQVGEYLVLRVLDDSVSGIQSQEINDGGDEVSLRLKIGAPISRRQITRRITSVAGVTRFVVR